MRLERIELENVCQHRKLVHVWHQGLNGIIGPNGSGKSNIIKAVRFAVTGTFDNAGTKAENICQLVHDKARSRVVLSFEHDGTEVEIVRALRRCTSSCRINGGEQIDGDNAVTEAVMDVLGVDQRILSEYIFVPQRHMASFVDETPGERNKTFGQLFDLARAEVIYKLLDAEAKRVNPPPPGTELASWRERVVRQRGRRDELLLAMDASYAELRKLNKDEAQALVDRADNWEQGQISLSTLTGLVDKLSADLDIRQAELAAAVAEQVELGAAKAGAAQDIAAAQGALVRWDAAQQRRKRHEELQARQVVLDAEVRKEPQPPEGYPGEKVAQDRIDELNHAIRVRKDFLAQWRDKPEVCPTCGSKTDTILSKALNYEAEMAGLAFDLDVIQKLQKAYVAYSKAHAEWQFWVKDHAKRKDVLAVEWKDYWAKAEEDPTADPEACKAVVDAGLTLERAIADMDVRIEQLTQEESRWAASLADSNLKLIKQKEKLGKQPDSRAVTGARAALKRIDHFEREIIRDKGELKAVTSDLDDNERMLVRLEEMEAKAEIDRLWVYHLGEIRKVMHHDRLPKVVAHNYLEILADDTNELLESFDADFRVSLGDGLNFAATFLRGQYAGAVSPAQRLSEGQKVLLALAFRVAVNSLFAGAAGLLCLDEPTESLDERNLACLEVAIGKMRDLSESRGLQCLLVTHEPSFEVLFDGVLRLVA
jgi:DNA repair exonuclease SbcCD ATPase subunit